MFFTFYKKVYKNDYVFFFRIFAYFFLKSKSINECNKKKWKKRII
jgi:hypothetical protein